MFLHMCRTRTPLEQEEKKRGWAKFVPPFSGRSENVFSAGRSHSPSEPCFYSRRPAQNPLQQSLSTWKVFSCLRCSLRRRARCRRKRASVDQHKEVCFPFGVTGVVALLPRALGSVAVLRCCCGQPGLLYWLISLIGKVVFECFLEGVSILFRLGCAMHCHGQSAIGKRSSTRRPVCVTHLFPNALHTSVNCC